MCILQFSLIFITIFFLNSVYVTADNGQTFGQCQNAQGQHCMKTLFILLSGFVSICNPFNNNKMKVEVLTLKSVRSTSDTNLVSRLFPKARERTLGTRLESKTRSPPASHLFKGRSNRLLSKARGPFLESPGDFSGPKSNI